MSTNNLLNTLSEYISITNKDIEIITQIFKKKEFHKSDNLLNQGEYSNSIFYIEKGLIRVFFLDQKGKEINTYFSTDRQFITSYSSFINQQQSLEFIQAMHDTIAYELKYSDFIKNNEFANKFRLLFAEQSYICIKKRVDLLQNSNGKEKYNYFLKNYNKKIVNNIPLLHIASYLGITAESLSRIRKNNFLSNVKSI